MELHIHGIGALSLGLDEPFVDEVGTLKNIPIAEYARPGLRRKFGRLAKIFYIAASRAIENADIEDIGELALVTSTAMGEATVSLDIIAQIHASKGKTLSPRLVPNSVHNSPAGHISIGKKNKRPSVTVSQGWLSAEAGLVAAEDFLITGLANKVLVVFGDEADSSWVERLEQRGAGHWAKKLHGERFQEGAVALVVGKEPGGQRLGSLVSRVERVRGGQGEGSIARMLESFPAKPSSNATIHVRSSAGGASIRSAVGAAFGVSVDSICLDGPGPGTAQAGPLCVLLETIRAGNEQELVAFGSELDELAFVHWKR
jgi:hypothetical protein